MRVPTPWDGAATFSSLLATASSGRLACAMSLKPILIQPLGLVKLEGVALELQPTIVTSTLDYHVGTIVTFNEECQRNLRAEPNNALGLLVAASTDAERG